MVRWHRDLTLTLALTALHFEEKMLNFLSRALPCFFVAAALTACAGDDTGDTDTQTVFITIVPVTTDLLTVLDENRKGIQIELRKWLPGTVQDRRSGLKKKNLLILINTNIILPVLTDTLRFNRIS